MERWIMHVDMDAFFAAIEQRDQPAYRQKPVIVGGLGPRGVVSTASYEARCFGVGSAMPMAEARRRCPQGIFLPGDHGHYHAVSREIFALLAEFSPCIEPLSIDEAFLDISGMEQLFASRHDYGRRLKKRIFAATGLVASVGIAPNKFLAKLASDLEKPDGLVVIERGQEKEVLHALPVRRLWGVGQKTAEKLSGLGLRTVGQVAGSDFAELQKYFGDKLAYQLIELANGRDERPVEPQRDPQSIGQEITFEQDVHSRAQVEEQLLSLAEKVGFRLRCADTKARTITLKVRTAAFKTITRSRTLNEETAFDDILYQTALELYRQAGVREGIRLLGLAASRLSTTEQGSLFPGDGRKEELYRTVDGLRARFGEGIITRAQLLGSDGAGKAGHKKKDLSQ